MATPQMCHFPSGEFPSHLWEVAQSKIKTIKCIINVRGTTLDIRIINVFIKFTKKVGETTFLSIQTIKCKDRMENCSDNKERKRKTWITTINKKDTPGYWIGLNSVILFCLEYPTSDPGSQMQQKRRRQHVVSFISINKGYKLVISTFCIIYSCCQWA